MSVEELEKAVAELPPEKLASFRRWFEEFDAREFDRKIEADARSGKLERLIEKSEEDFRAGHYRKL